MKLNLNKFNNLIKILKIKLSKIFKKIIEFCYKNLFKKRFTKSIIKFVIFFFFILLIIFTIFDLFITISNKKKIYSSINLLDKKEYCLLLGTSKYTTKKTENLFYKYRIEAVKELYKYNLFNKIILSGDSREKYYDETKFMKNDLLKLDFPEEILIVDTDGYRTIWSVTNLFKKYNIKEAIVVSQDFHLQRALFIGSVFGLNLIGYKAKAVNGLSGLKIQLRERGARVKLFFELICYFFNKNKFTKPIPHKIKFNKK
jgi:SanA protein